MSEVPYVAFTEENRVDYSPPQIGEYPEPIGYEDVRFQAAAVMLIAETTTLHPDYFSLAGLDRRYPKDRGRLEAIETSLSRPEVSLTDDQRNELFGAFCMGILESKPTELVYEMRRPDDEDNTELAAFLDGELTARTIPKLKELWAKIFCLPKSLRPFVFEDPASATKVLDFFSASPGIESIVDTSMVADTLQTLGIAQCRGEERLAAITANTTTIRDAVRSQSEREAWLIASGGEGAAQLQADRFNRIRYVSDSIDARLFRVYTNAQVILDPAYLYSDEAYEGFETEHAVSFEAKLAFLKHMIAGEWVYGHDHTYLFRNKYPDIANQRIGIVPDYATVRAGNYLFHDLKMLERSPFRDDYPLDVVMTYVMRHYLEQMDMHIIDGSKPDDVIGFENQGTYYEVPLKHEPEHVIPFRALKKDLASTEYFEYDESCYIAELVDVATQLDLIEERRNSASVHPLVQVGTMPLGKHAGNLIRYLHDIDQQNGSSICAIAVEQILFMNAKTAATADQDAHDAINACLDTNQIQAFDNLRSLTITEDRREDGTLVTPLQPLSCYYNWFLRNARYVPEDELIARGILPTPALYAKNSGTEFGEA